MTTTSTTVEGVFCPDCGTVLATTVNLNVSCPGCGTVFDLDEPCGDCARPVVWDEAQQRYRHGFDAGRGCFLLGGEGILNGEPHVNATTGRPTA